MELIGFYRMIMRQAKYEDDAYQGIKSLIESDDTTDQYLGVKSMIQHDILQPGDKAHLEFCGSGDSGSVDLISWGGPSFVELSAEDYHMTDTSDDDLWGVLNVITYDWYNNDGGSGYINVDLFKLTYEIEGYYYYTEEELGQQESGSLFPEFEKPIVQLDGGVSLDVSELKNALENDSD